MFCNGVDEETKDHESDGGISSSQVGVNVCCDCKKYNESDGGKSLRFE